MDEYEKNKQNKKAQWALFISDPNIKEVEEIMKSNEDIEEAVVTVHKMTEDEKMRRIADLREKAILDEKAIRRKGYQDGHDKGYEDGRSDGYQDGISKGRAKGQNETKEQIAKRMKLLNMSDEDICKILDIPKEELAKLEL